MSDFIHIDGKRVSTDEGSRILQHMLDEVSDNEEHWPTSDCSGDEYLPSSSDEETENNVEEDDYEDDCIEEIEGSESVSTESIQYLTGKNGMKWSSQVPRIHQTPSRNIMKDKPGPKVERPCSLKNTLKLVLTPEMLSIIVRETNREANRVYQEWNKANRTATSKLWKEMDELELEAYIGLLISAGAYRSGREDLSEMWNEEHGRPVFRATMRLKRFQAITRFLRFDNKHTRPQRKAEDKLAAFRDVWEMFIQRLSSIYTPGCNITVDEQLVGYRGRCPFLQYMKSKPAKYGIKIWWACDSANSFPLNGQVYLGKQPNQPRDINQGNRVVKELTAKWLNKGRNIVADNFFTSIPLVQELVTQKTTFVGTLRRNKAEIPKEMQPQKSREIHSSIFLFAGPLTMVSYVPKKSSAVILLSSMHQTKTVMGEEHKPEIIMHYNANKGGVDNLDKMIGTYSVKRNTKRWPMVLFFNMIDVACIAAMIIWLCHHPESLGKSNQKRRHFLLQLGRQLIHPFIEQRLLERRCFQKGARTGLLALGYDYDTPAKVKDTRACPNKRKRCHLCPRSEDKKIKTLCENCGQNICKIHSKNIVSCLTCLEENK